MEVVLVTRAEGGCSFCDKALGLLRERRVPFKEVPASAEALRVMCLSLGVPATFPKAFVSGRCIGGYTDLLDMMDEPLLMPSESRFVYHPILHTGMHDMWKRAIASFWTVEEIDMSRDGDHWGGLSAEEREFIKVILAFFAGADGIVNENLVANLCTAVQAPEARAFYTFQAFNESQHAEMYSLLLDSLVKDPEEKRDLFNGIKTIPSVGKKAEWALKWLAPGKRFAERLVAFACVEGIMFSSSFCAIFWLRKRGLMPGLSLSNDFIARDEGMHQMFACHLLASLRSPPDAETVQRIVRDAVEVEEMFVQDLLPQSLVGMTREDMTQYVHFIADNLLHQMNVPPIYNTRNPFPFMETIGLMDKTNFFERRTSSYSKPGVLGSKEENTFSLDATF